LLNIDGGRRLRELCLALGNIGEVSRSIRVGILLEGLLRFSERLVGYVKLCRRGLAGGAKAGAPVCFPGVNEFRWDGGMRRN